MKRIKERRNPEMKNLIKNLQAVNRNLTALSKKVDKIIVQVGKLEKPKSAKKTTAKAKPVKKVVVKQTAKLTAADTLFGIIKRFKKGTDVATLMKKTGFNRRKIYDNVKILKKQGKIRTAGIGVYVKA
jgi:Zn-dependent oligopeptidase